MNKKTIEPNQVAINLNKQKYGFGNRVVDESSVKLFLDDCKKFNFYNWNNISFVPKFELLSYSCPSNLEIKNCKFINLKLLNVKFKGSVLFYDCDFTKVQFANIKSNSRFIIEECTFDQEVLIDGKFKHAEYKGCEFKGAVTFRGHYEESVLFMNCRFLDKAKWMGMLTLTGNASGTMLRFISSSGVNFKPKDKNLSFYWAMIKGFIGKSRERFKQFYVIASKQIINKIEVKIKEVIGRYFISDSTAISKLFDGTAHFQDVDFSRPDQVYFSSVNLSRTIFSGTDLRGVHLEGVDFYQPLLGRHGLIGEVSQLNIKNKLSNSYSLPKLESAYRKMRVCLEESKDFGIATDMYVGEMEAKRKQLHFLRRNIFSTEALFRLVSNYGQSAIKAFLVLGALIIIHFYISTNLLGHIGLSGFFDEDVKQTLRVVSFQNVDRDKSETYLGMIDTLFRILVPIQAGMFALALRIKIKRH